MPNYGSALGAAVAARDAIRAYQQAEGAPPFRANSLELLRRYGLNESAIPFLSIATATNSGLDERTIVAVSRSPLGRHASRQPTYVVLRSGDVVEAPREIAVLGSLCATNAAHIVIPR